MNITTKSIITQRKNAERSYMTNTFTLNRRIGSTNFSVNVSFTGDSSAESLEDKTIRTYVVEVITNVTAHKVMACNCPMRNGKKVTGTFPKAASAVKQYSPNLRAFAVSLLTQGYVSIDRTRQIIGGSLSCDSGKAF